jgi:hypothetical protein
MASIVLNGDTSGSVTLSPPAVAGTQTVTLPAATGTVMVSGNMPAFSAYAASVSQSITSGTTTKVQFPSERFDTANCFDSTTNYRFTPNVAGYYQVNYVVRNISGNPVTLISFLYKNGSSYSVGYQNQGFTTRTIYADVGGSDLVYMNGSTDYLEVYFYSDGSSPSLSDTTLPYVSYFSGSLVRAS